MNEGGCDNFRSGGKDILVVDQAPSQTFDEASRFDGERMRPNSIDLFQYPSIPIDVIRFDELKSLLKLAKRFGVVLVSEDTDPKTVNADITRQVHKYLVDKPSNN
ncbi:hypothetical protein [Mesorhizobium sp. B4-1-4]|uniref:hypothetical protein n=1 Tax=Mesorhizobium sp. B4-1-4 TaxID=2589888 RepID=UPI0011279B54|nr:hypothetical protein [Mesorhizobium sp. B4-1-4]UCI30951.1 hypothetical protein FJW03_24700 [Mesorhizobium sp. B4-1-4]